MSRFLSLLIVILIEHALKPIHSLKNDTWFIAWMDKLTNWRNVQKFSAKLRFGLVILLPLAAFFILWQLSPKFLCFLLSILVLLYTLRPVTNDATPADCAYKALSSWFSVIFWFCILGPIGALAYRFLRIIEERPVAEAGIAGMASASLNYADWIPVRLMVLTYALASYFSQVISVLMQHLMARPSQNKVFLSEALSAAIPDLSEKPEELMKLQKRTLWVWLIAIFFVALM